MQPNDDHARRISQAAANAAAAQASMISPEETLLKSILTTLNDILLAQKRTNDLLSTIERNTHAIAIDADTR